MTTSPNLKSLLSMVQEDAVHPSTSKATAPAKILLVDDDNAIRFSLSKILEHHGFNVSSAANVSDALRLISSESFDILLSDLHMPGPGDGLTVVSAMRHANPKAATILISAYPDMTKAAAAILRQADEVILKPVKAAAVVETIRRRLDQERPEPRPYTVEPV